ncbi:hypothetical protein E9232_007087 [Inquilinus ginsengisoli]|uniref:Uncharacterized protein n=1 Tax=Inquilinus ginsengisoli TaxID=363840 RepID=A0ABU1K1U1_9PROT|nr:hypothetical protein [Inquilinus ginsengisoli]
MHMISDPNTAGQRRLPANLINQNPARRSDPDWRPEPCGLTREELRKITADLIG